MRTDNTRDERAKRARLKKLASGMASRTVYLPLDTLESLASAFPGPAGGIAWEKAAETALTLAHRRQTQGERIRRLRAEGKQADPTMNDRARRYRDNHREEIAARARQRRAKRKAEREAAATAT